MALAKRSIKKGMDIMGKIQMRKMQKRNSRKRKAIRPHKACSKYKKGLSRLGRLLRKIVYRCLGL